MSRLAFWRPQLEDLFAFQLAERTCGSAALCYSVASALSLAALVRCCMVAAAASLTPRLAVLILVTLVSLAANARALAVIARPSQVLFSQQTSISTPVSRAAGLRSFFSTEVLLMAHLAPLLGVPISTAPLHCLVSAPLT